MKTTDIAQIDQSLPGVIPGRAVQPPETRHRRPRIALLTNYPYDGTAFSGGVETATAGLLEGLEKYVDEFDLHIVALSKDIPQHRNEVRNGMVFHFLAVPREWYARPHVIPNIFNTRAELKKLQADLVHCQDNMAMAIGAMNAQASKKVFTVHGIKSVESHVWEGPEYWSHRMDAMLERWVRRHFEEVITISPYVDAFLPAHVRKHHITNPVRKLFFEGSQSGRDRHHILFVGVLTRLKRPLDVIKAFGLVKKQFTDASLTIVGKAEDRKYMLEMERYIQEERLTDVRFAGTRPQTEVAALMRKASVLTLASVQENTPMVIAESMASGLPVVASRVGGVPAMMLDTVDGLLFDCGNIEELAACVVKIFSQEGLRERFSQQGSEKAVAVYSSEAVAAATVNVYRTMLSL